MQTPRTLIRPVGQRSLIIHPMPCQALRNIEPIAFVGPPAVNAVGERVAMPRPVIHNLAWASFLAGRRRNGSMQITFRWHDVKNDLEIIGVQIMQHRRWFTVEKFRIEFKRIVSPVPARRTKSGAEIN